MTDTPEPGPAPKRGVLPLLIGLMLALVLGAGGFYATWSGMVGATKPASSEVAHLPDIAFVPLDPLVISLGDSAQARHLRFTAQLEVPSAYRAEVTSLTPRILDVLNGYLRAVAVEDLADPASLITLRAQMLRRVRIVTGEGRVRDLLIAEFVLN